MVHKFWTCMIVGTMSLPPLMFTLEDVVSPLKLRSKFVHLFQFGYNSYMNTKYCSPCWCFHHLLHDCNKFTCFLPLMGDIDETLPIINKPKAPNKGVIQGTKWKDPRARRQKNHPRRWTTKGTSSSWTPSYDEKHIK
jgi:hypothetical protein